MSRDWVYWSGLHPGVKFYVANKQELYPVGTLFKLLGLWLATGLVGGIPQKAFGNRNPFDKMSEAERQRAIAIVRNMGNRQKLDTADGV